ncbi:hypothetical protein FPV67DRAFT_1748840 [Lyophyllum atratum]|nr:hypothetical protein FPV67DRAFT_1748840 [Lyophyllum atratum]
MAYPESLTGQCTRAYPVYESDTGRLYFMKDSWRAEEHGKESAILRTLQKAGVQHISGLVCGDDIPHQTTVTNLHVPLRDRGTAQLEACSTGLFCSQQADPVTEFGDPSAVLSRPKNASWICGNDRRRITGRYHHRMITDVIGSHLKNFTSSKQMMEAISQAFTAHQQAYELCKIIHRDISAYNILITENGQGILSDWDLANYEKDIAANSPRRQARTGTWQFMSCLLLMDRHKPHTIQDDIESFVHLILYHSIRYLRHTKSHTVRALLSKIFDDVYQEDDGSQVGGISKKSLFRDKEKFKPFKNFQLMNNAPLNAWIYDALYTVDEWIKEVDSDGVKMEDSELANLRLYDHQYMAEQFASCLQQQGWPSGDKAVDYLPAVAHGSTSSQSGSTGISRGSGSKRSLSIEDNEGYEGPGSKAKKQKAGGSEGRHSSR